MRPCAANKGLLAHLVTTWNQSTLQSPPQTRQEDSCIAS